MSYKEFEELFRKLDEDVRIALWLTLIESRQRSELPEMLSDTSHKCS